jgi:AraC-like DNA-binding protein
MTEIFDDIRKLYVFRVPCPELAEFIEFFSETSPDAADKHLTEDTFTVKLFASFTPTIWLNMGTSYELYKEGTATRIDKTADILVLRSTTLERKNLFTDNIFTIKFLPLGFEAIFGISQAAIGDGILKADDILGTDIIKKVKRLESLKERSLFLEKILIEKLKRNFSNKNYMDPVKRAIQLFSCSGMDSRLSHLTCSLYISEKTFYRYFQKSIGTNPKDFFLVTRCREALSVYRKDKASFCPYDFGYYDYAHFSKEVIRFTGASLTSLKMVK